MRLADSPAEAVWRQEVRAFITHELPGELRRGAGAQMREDEAAGGTAAMRGGEGYQQAGGALGAWRQKIVQRGWLAPAWPKEWGGSGLSVMEQFILNQEFAEAGAPHPGGRGVTHLGPTLITHGTPEQQARFLGAILRGETQWCQGFSEPGAGSDLASLQTRAVRDGDDFVINGQKIWTSGAHRANWMFMLARTDPEAPKHRGISYFLLDMTTPGITIQPLINMAGNAGFNQVFFDNVRVPAGNVVGEVNRGWYVGTTTLDFERSGIGSAVGTRKTVERLIRRAKENVANGISTLGRNREVRLELADRHVEAMTLMMLSYRVVSLQNAGKVPNYEASMAKLYFSELEQRITRTAMKVVGMYGMLYDTQSPRAPFRASYARGYLGSIAATIGGGTSEVQRNIIATRGLGLPHD